MILRVCTNNRLNLYVDRCKDTSRSTVAQASNKDQVEPRRHFFQKQQRVSTMNDAAESTLARVLRRRPRALPKTADSRNPNACIAWLSKMMKPDAHKMTVISGMRNFFAEVN